MSAHHNITIEQGATFALAFTYYPQGQSEDPIDWSGWTGAGQVRTRPSNDVLLDFDVSGDSSGRIQVLADADTTRELATGRALYDVEMDNGDGFVIRILQGTALITPEITHD